LCPFRGHRRIFPKSNGENFKTLGQLCLISFYDFWNDYLRREYVIAKGHLDPNEQEDEKVKACLKKYASYDLWGDMRHLRTSIVHKQGIATADVANCKLIKWFKPSDPIAITPERMGAIFLATRIYSNQLFAEHFPRTYIQL
jgi:hypothetical protein